MPTASRVDVYRVPNRTAVAALEDIEQCVREEEALQDELQAALNNVARITSALEGARSKLDIARQSRIPQLNDDLIATIIDCLRPDLPYFDSPSSRGLRRIGYDYPFFASLCLVARCWLHPARKVLYQTIPDFSRSKESFRAFSNTIMSVPEVRPYVRLVDTSLTHHYGSGLLELVTLLPRCLLFVSRLYWHPNAGFKDSLDALLCTQSLVGLHSIDFPWSMTQWKRGLEHWSSLKSLGLFNSFLSLPSYGSDFDAASFLPSLRNLRLQHVDVGFPPLPQTHYTR
jgi:hypothetical protein